MIPTKTPPIRRWMFATAACAILSPQVWAAEPDLKVPDGFVVEVWADDVPNARTLVQGEQGTVFVSTREDGRLYAVRDTDGDGRADRTWTIAEDLNSPNGIAFHDGALYVAEIARIWRLDGIEDRLDSPPEPVSVRDDLPDYSHHGWRYIAFGPDDKLYLALGAPCNVCEPTTFERDGKTLETASITRMNADGSDWEMVAYGVRNSVGFDWHPETGTLYFTDNGRDWLGDDLPDCELNRVTEIGAHYGFPYCHAGTVSDPEFGEGKSCADYVAPVALLGPHVAPLGMRFHDGERFLKEARDTILVALHGSWNRSEKIGYEVIALQPQAADGDYRQSTFVGGFLDDGDVSGRPVDLLVLDDGSVLVSDDMQGRVLRVSRAK